jgi:alpha-tubulin suppressor-like RCC1 family protein
VFESLAAGAAHTCGVTPGGAIYCWGLNTSGQLGNGTRRTSPAPVLVAGGHRFSQVTAGAQHTCGLTDGGSIYCWGQNRNGQLGSELTSDTQSSACGPCSTTPVRVPEDLTFAAVSAGGQHTCAVTEEGEGFCWGRNNAGQLGIGVALDRTPPQAVLGGLRFVTIDAGGAHTCGISRSGATYCWGDNLRFQLGNGGMGLRSTEPVLIELPAP